MGGRNSREPFSGHLSSEFNIYIGQVVFLEYQQISQPILSLGGFERVQKYYFSSGIYSHRYTFQQRSCQICTLASCLLLIVPLSISTLTNFSGLCHNSKLCKPKQIGYENLIDGSKEPNSRELKKYRVQQAFIGGNLPGAKFLGPATSDSFLCFTKCT